MTNFSLPNDAIAEHLTELEVSSPSHTTKEPAPIVSPLTRSAEIRLLEQYTRKWCNLAARPLAAEARLQIIEFINLYKGRKRIWVTRAKVEKAEEQMAEMFSQRTLPRFKLRTTQRIPN